MSEVWNEFLPRLERDVLPIYAAHEARFDPRSAHGRMHICRALIFAEFMVRALSERLKIDHEAVLTATAFHDAGREDNGPDLWEPQSAQMCERYLLSQGHPEAYATSVGQMIVKKLPSVRIEKEIVTDADVLDIMRPAGCGGIQGFQRKRLSFLRARNEDSLRDRLILDAWTLIQETEHKRGKYLAMPNPLLGMCAWIQRTSKAPLLRSMLRP